MCDLFKSLTFSEEEKTGLPDTSQQEAQLDPALSSSSSLPFNVVSAKSVKQQSNWSLDEAKNRKIARKKAKKMRKERAR